MSAIPCQQAARAPGVPSPPPLSMQVQIEAIPELPRPPVQAQALQMALADPVTRWPYHLPAYNGVDCLWWSMLARAVYWSDDTWIRRVAAWAGPIARLTFVDRSVPSRQGYAFVELGDCVLVVIPGTSSEAEALAYIMTHSLALTTSVQPGPMVWNSAWADRGFQVLTAYSAWPAPQVRKPIIVIGHSSGGAYGAYFAFRRDDNIDYLTTLVTFGAPIWGTPSLENHYRNFFAAGARIQIGQLRPQVIDFGTPNDIVTTLPPPWAAVDLLIPGYAQANRPTYARFTNLILLGLNSGPTPVDQPATLPAVTHAVITLVRGGGLGVEHGMPNYTAGAQRWCNNDASITDAGLDTERTALNAILAAMNTAGVGA